MKKKRKKVSRLRRLRVSAQSASASVASLERAERGALLNIELPIARLRRLSNAPSAPRPKFNVILFL